MMQQHRTPLRMAMVCLVALLVLGLAGVVGLAEAPAVAVEEASTDIVQAADPVGITPDAPTVAVPPAGEAPVAGMDDPMFVAAPEGDLQAVDPQAADVQAAPEALVIEDPAVAAQREATRRVEAFFGVDSIAGDEGFYMALYEMSVARAGMPLTIQLADNAPVYFDGTLHQTTYTTGAITSTPALPTYYVVTFSATVEGRVPGTYAPQVSSLSVVDSRNGMDMTRFFTPAVTGGTLTVDGTGSILMLSVDDIALEFTGLPQQGVSTTGTAFINWEPMSAELRVRVRAAGTGTVADTPLTLADYAVEVIADGTDITEHFEYVFTYDGTLRFTPPEEPVEAEIAIETWYLPYTGRMYNSPRATSNDVGGVVTVNGQAVQGATLTFDFYYYDAMFATGDLKANDERNTWSVQVASTGQDITDYFAFLGDVIWGYVVITPPETPIPLTVVAEDMTVWFSIYQQNIPYRPKVYLDGEVTTDLKAYSGEHGIYIHVIKPGTYLMDPSTQPNVFARWDGEWYYATEYHDVTYVTGTLTVLP